MQHDELTTAPGPADTIDGDAVVRLPLRWSDADGFAGVIGREMAADYVEAVVGTIGKAREVRDE